LNFPAERLTGYLRRAFAARDQPMFHAVGDAAIDAVLDGLERSGGDKWEPLRPRIEHGDMLEPSHFERTRRLGVIIVQNPSHFMLAPLMNARLGDRARRASMMKSTMAANVPVALGSDGPLNPYLNLMFATILANNPSEAMTREQAIGAYTLGSARAEFAEAQKGTIAPGMLADLAMLSQDIFTVPTDALPATTSVFTLVGGRVAFEKN
jgi:predicted amidohydrolase YtcJ